MPGRGYCVWEPRVGNAFRCVIERSVSVPELAESIVRLFIGLWSNCTKASRTSLVL